MTDLLGGSTLRTRERECGLEILAATVRFVFSEATPKMKRGLALQESFSGPRRAIVYEDDESCGYSFAAMLRKAGYEVLTTAHFEPVLKAMESRHPPQLLVADIAVPPGHVNGVAMARLARIKRLELKVIYVSGYDVPKGAGELDWPLLRKPVTEEDLLAAVQQVMSGS